MGVISLAVIKLSLLALLGFYLSRKGYIVKETLNFLTLFVINIAIPCLIFSHLIDNASIVLTEPLWIFLLLSVVVFLAGCLIALPVYFQKKCLFHREFVSVVSLQNAGYLPMNIAMFLPPAYDRERFLAYVFLYLLGFNVIMWSVGSFLIFKKEGEKFKLNTVFNPPVIGTIAALLLLYTNTAGFIPGIIFAPIKMIGETSFVFSMIVLGSWLAKIKLEGLGRRLFFIAEASFLKLILLPLLFLIIVIKSGMSSLLGLFIVLQAALPSAASLPIVVSLKDADSGFISKAVFITHVISIITIPFWLGLYLKLSGFLF